MPERHGRDRYRNIVGEGGRGRRRRQRRRPVADPARVLTCRRRCGSSTTPRRRGTTGPQRALEALGDVAAARRLGRGDGAVADRGRRRRCAVHARPALRRRARPHDARDRDRRGRRAHAVPALAGEANDPTRTATGWRRRSRTTRSTGEAIVSTTVAATAYPLFDWTQWDEAQLAECGARAEQMPKIGVSGQPLAEVHGRPGCVLEGGTIDAIGEQIVAGARRRRRRARDLRHDADRVGRRRRAGRGRGPLHDSAHRAGQVPRRRSEQRGRAVPQLGRPHARRPTPAPRPNRAAFRSGRRTRAASACRSRTRRGARSSSTSTSRTMPPRFAAPRSKRPAFVTRRMIDSVADPGPPHRRDRRRHARRRVDPGARRLHRPAGARVRGARRRRARRRVPGPAGGRPRDVDERRGALGAHRTSSIPTRPGPRPSPTATSGSARSRAEHGRCRSGMTFSNRDCAAFVAAWLSLAACGAAAARARSRGPATHGRSRERTAASAAVRAARRRVQVHHPGRRDQAVRSPAASRRPTTSAGDRSPTCVCLWEYHSNNGHDRRRHLSAADPRLSDATAFYSEQLYPNAEAAVAVWVTVRSTEATGLSGAKLQYVKGGKTYAFDYSINAIMGPKIDKSQMPAQLEALVRAADAKS